MGALQNLLTDANVTKDRDTIILAHCKVVGQTLPTLNSVVTNGNAHAVILEKHIYVDDTIADGVNAVQQSVADKMNGM